MISALFDPIQNALARESIFRKAFLERPDSLSDFLAYSEWSPKENIFRLKDGSLGAVYELDLIEHEPLNGETIAEKVASLTSWFSLPTNCTFQVLFDQSRLSSMDSGLTSLESKYLRGHPVSQALFRRRMDDIRKACQDPSLFSPYRRQGVISIRFYPPSVSKRSKPKKYKGQSGWLYAEMQEAIREMRDFQHLLLGFERGSKLELRRMDAPALLDLLRRYFNPLTYYKRPFAPYNPNISLSKQVLYNQPLIDHASLNREGVLTRTLSLLTSPLYAYPGGMAYFLTIPFPFRLAINFSFPTRQKVNLHFGTKSTFLEHSFSPRTKRQKSELEDVQNRLAADDRCLHMTFNVVLEATSEDELDAQTRDILNVFHNDLQCEVITDESIGFGLWLNTLPLQYTPPADGSSRRKIRILRSDATKFLPVFDSFRGLRDPLQVHLSREQNVVPFSLLENETSNHSVVLADSGSGKSAFVIDCIQSAKRLDPEPMVFVIDKESSYKMMAKYFDADITVFDRKGPVPFSPFRGTYDEDKIAVLTNLVISALELTSPKFDIDSDHRTAISKALKLAYVKKERQQDLTYVDGELKIAASGETVQLTMNELVAELGALPSTPGCEKLSTVCESLAQKLKPFYGDGPYAKFFNSKAQNKTHSKLFYIYDLDPLSSDTILQTLITRAVFEEIRELIKSPEHRHREKFLVLEEFAMVGRNNPTAREFIIDFAERLRKLGCWLIALTPRPQNYFDTEVGKALWGVADNFIFLQMAEDNVKDLTKFSDLIDEPASQIIRSLRTKRGEYADVYYMNKKKTKCGAFHFLQSSLDRWLAPTNAKDARTAERVLKRHPEDPWKALQELADKYPRGFQSESEEASQMEPLKEAV